MVQTPTSEFIWSQSNIRYKSKFGFMLPDTIRNIIAVGAGSFIGGIARYLVSLVMKGISKGFPWATLLVTMLQTGQI